ncbi:uncharacterized protein LOC108733824 [Agrilus planipennis]|uniref:Uncharacterized protein LOC108733824 n=1 Tax=Agrilus planipennis TaxID=224129 RepID=A0A1W4WKT9_AGRPL|nr:uncharacterized protein LOC108733824 [Agrilus planipennis]
MSPRCQVLPLQKLCCNTVATQLTQAVCDDEELDYETLQSYIRDSTYEVLQDLLNLVLASCCMDASIRFNCLQLLLREDVKRLETDVFPHNYYENILKTILEKGTGLTYLNLKGIWARENLSLLCDIVKGLKKLKTFVVPHIADDQLLNAIGTYGNLTCLDVSGECSFTSSNLVKFKSQSLKILSIGNFGKKDVCQDEQDSIETISKLVQNLPNLIALQTFSFTGNALSRVYEKNSNFRTKLEYIHDTLTTEDTCEAIVKTCPNLKSVYLDTPLKNTLKVLSTLKSLHTLKLSKPLYEELMGYLEKSGYQIQVLKLISVKENVVDLGEICKNAPNLQTLECFKMSLTSTKIDYYFMHLESVDLSYCNTSNFILRFLLMNSPKLRRLVIGDGIKFNDDDMFRLCSECELLELEEVWFASAKCLTLTSVELLMTHCPKLKVLGQITEWDINPNDVNFLKAVIASTNTQLILLSRERIY